MTEWLGDDKPGNPKKHYAKEFIDHYMDPHELNERMEQLAEEFPDLVEIVEMPNETNGYRRHAQATLGSTATPLLSSHQKLGAMKAETTFLLNY